MSLSNIGSGDEEVPVKLPSGAVFYVHPEELAYIRERAIRYTKDNALPNISDLQDLDRVLQLELLCFRWANWITRQRDYWGDPVDPNLLQKALKEHSSEVRLLKKQLGIDKPARTKETGIDSPIAYIEKLKERAKHFGINRDNMTAKAIELFQEASAFVTFSNNCTPDEQRENRCTPQDFFEWFRDIAIPEFEAIDKHFRETNQKTWIQDM